MNRFSEPTLHTGQMSRDSCKPAQITRENVAMTSDKMREATPVQGVILLYHTYMQAMLISSAAIYICDCADPCLHSSRASPFPLKPTPLLCVCPT